MALEAAADCASIRTESGVASVEATPDVFSSSTCAPPNNLSAACVTIYWSAPFTRVQYNRVTMGSMVFTHGSASACLTDESEPQLPSKCILTLARQRTRSTLYSRPTTIRAKPQSK